MTPGSLCSDSQIAKWPQWHRAWCAELHWMCETPGHVSSTTTPHVYTEFYHYYATGVTYGLGWT